MTLLLFPFFILADVTLRDCLPNTCFASAV
jgi:hypothetical protein